MRVNKNVFNFFLSLNNKLDILFGPIDLRDYLDGSLKRTCVITICSNKLLDTTSNLYFLNLKAPRVIPIILVFNYFSINAFFILKHN